MPEAPEDPKCNDTPFDSRVDDRRLDHDGVPVTVLAAVLLGKRLLGSALPEAAVRIARDVAALPKILPVRPVPAVVD